MSGSLRASLDGDDTLLLSNAVGQSIARYAGLYAYDATGRQLAARLAIQNSQLVIHVDDADAAYPITVDPWIQRGRLTAADGAEGDFFGYSIAIDGDTVVVGANRTDVGGITDTGAVYVFVRPEADWSDITHKAKLTAGDGAEDDRLGYSVTIEGDTVVAGALRADIGGNGSQGAAYVFVKPGATWSDVTHAAKLTAADGSAGVNLGYSIAIDGDTIVVGANNDNGLRGAAYVFVKPGATWSDATHTAKLTADDGEGADYLGLSVAIDGDTVVAGAAYANIGDNNNQGAAYVFVEPMEGWRDITHTAKLTAADGMESDELGWSVGIDGDIVVVGARTADADVITDTGAAYIFIKPVEGWRNVTQTAKLTADDGAEGDNFGHSADIDGDTVVVGARYADIGTVGRVNRGAAYVFAKPVEGWSDIVQTAKLTAATGAAGDYFGHSVAIDGDTIVAGAYGTDIGGHNSQGAAYVFTNMTSDLNIVKTVTPMADVALPQHRHLHRRPQQQRRVE